ncbi:hypothetical protein SORBI_3002G229600 [Sorghum bicolor]|uniref:Uncharacterized protein n=1 Tax=Sorghum bicolor TaxID=4558 RepID=A0A1B6QCZ5_SORBI|nr:hypothetical protein SORBI_3002G229600 [Sorghum bicolor]
MPRILPTLPCSRSHKFSRCRHGPHKFSRCRPIPDARPSLAPPHDPSSLQTVLRLPNIASVLSPSVVQASGRPHRLQQTVFAASSSRESVGGRCLRASRVCRRKVPPSIAASSFRPSAEGRRESGASSSRVRGGTVPPSVASPGRSPRASGRDRRTAPPSVASPRRAAGLRARPRRAAGLRVRPGGYVPPRVARPGRSAASSVARPSVARPSRRSQVVLSPFIVQGVFTGRAVLSPSDPVGSR